MEARYAGMARKSRYCNMPRAQILITNEYKRDGEIDEQDSCVFFRHISWRQGQLL